MIHRMVNKMGIEEAIREAIPKRKQEMNE